MMETFRPTPPLSNATVDTILSHHSVRDYTDASVSEEALTTMFLAAQSASTSSSLNAWSAVIVRDPSAKRFLMDLTQGNPFILDAPVLIVWVADLSRNARLAESAGRKPRTLDYQESVLLGAVDTALAAQNAAVAAESLGLGICYVGGIRTQMQQVIDYLELPKYCFPVFGMTVGHPSQEDRAGVKPRLPLHAVIFNEKYSVLAADEGLPALEDAHRRYYEGQGKEGISWKRATVGRTAKISLMKGRENNRPVIASQGLLDH